MAPTALFARQIYSAGGAERAVWSTLAAQRGPRPGSDGEGDGQPTYTVPACRPPFVLTLCAFRLPQWRWESRQ